MAHEEALFVVVRVDKPAGDALGAATFDSACIDKAGSKRINDAKVPLDQTSTEISIWFSIAV